MQSSNLSAKMQEMDISIPSLQQKLHVYSPLPMLIAVSKGQNIELMRHAFECGLVHFGENYWQEALPKILALKDLPLVWHFIGPIQSNKAKAIAEHFDWVQSVSNETIAKKLNDSRSKSRPPLNVCIQVNLDEEASKSGCALKDLVSLAEMIKACPQLRLRGLLALPKPEETAEKQYASLLRFKIIFEQLQKDIQLPLDTLSMGTSQDWPAALQAGSTCIRIGQALFGEREKRK